VTDTQLLDPQAAALWAGYVTLVLTGFQLAKKLVLERVGWLAHGKGAIVGALVTALVVTLPELIPAFDGGLTLSELIHWISWAVTAGAAAAGIHAPVRKHGFTR
jgi:hypothetical protein